MTEPIECDNCGEFSTTVIDRDNGSCECDLCWADSLAFGHFHGMHQDDDGNPLIVDGCPTCAGHTPPAYRT